MQADTLQRIEISDECDGSVYVTLDFVDGSTHSVSADLSPDFSAVSERAGNGVMSYACLVDDDGNAI